MANYDARPVVEIIQEMKVGIMYEKRFTWGRLSIVPIVTVLDGGLCPTTEIFAGEGNWYITFDAGTSSHVSCPARDMQQARKWVEERLADLERAYTEATTNRDVVLPEPEVIYIPHSHAVGRRQETDAESEGD